MFFCEDRYGIFILPVLEARDIKTPASTATANTRPPKTSHLLMFLVYLSYLDLQEWY